MSEWTNWVGVRSLHVRMTYPVRTQLAYSYEWKIGCFFFFCFLLDFCIPPRSGGLRNTSFVFFVVPSGCDWRIPAVFFCVGQVSRTSHDATRPKKHVRDASVPRCRGLLQQAPPSVCSCCRRHRADSRICSCTTLYSIFFSFCFFVIFHGWFFKVLGISLLLFAPAVFLHFVIFHVSFTAKQSICARAAWWLYYSKRKQPTMYTWNTSGCATHIYIIVRRFKTGSGRCY